MKKLRVLLLCLLLATALISCGSDPTPTPAPVPEADPVTYDEIVAKYTEVLTAAKDGADLSTLERTGVDTLGEDVVNAIYDTVAACEDPAKMGYGQKDLDGDGANELLLMAEDGTAYALFTLKDNNAAPVININGKGGISESGLIYRYGYTTETDTGLKVTYSESEIYTLRDGKPVGHHLGERRTLGADGIALDYYKVENGQHVSLEKDEYNALALRYLPDTYANTQAAYAAMTLSARFRYTPILGADQSKNGETVDYSSYDAVLKTYKKVVEASASWSETTWKSGGYQGLFATDSSLEYDYTDRLLTACSYARLAETANANKAFGYAKKDLNGDGSEELILQNELQEIVAVFAMSEHGATLLFASDGNTEALIGADGRLYIERNLDRQNGMEIEIRSVTAAGTPQSDLHYGMLVNGWDTQNYYKVENGLRIDASVEELQAALTHDDLLADGQTEKEYRHSMTGALHTPLYEDTRPDQSIVGVWEAGGVSRIEITAFDGDSVTLSLLECDWSTGVFTSYLTATAVKDGDRYIFENEFGPCYLELGVASVRLYVTRDPAYELEGMGCTDFTELAKDNA